MTPLNYSVAFATTPAIGAYLREFLKILFGMNSSSAPRPIRVEFDKGETQGRIYGCFDAATVRR